MSGSSLDGIDVVICSFDEGLIPHLHFSKNIALEKEHLALIRKWKSLSTKEFFLLEGRFSSWLGEELLNIIQKVKLPVDLIVSHGHTIYHNPEENVTIQIGNGGVISSITKIDTLSDLRIQDIALGGQGAPLASLYDKILFKDYDLMLNGGGIANLSMRSARKIISWDVGFCNQVFNYLAEQFGQSYDDGGKLASTGNLIPDLYKAWEQDEYFIKHPPKSLDNGWVQDKMIPILHKYQGSIQDKMYTAVHFSIDRIINDIQKLRKSGSPLKLVFTGGGAFNTYYVNALTAKAKKINVQVELPDPRIIEYKEAILMSLMGQFYRNQKSNTVSTATGAERDIVAGAFYYGNNA